MNVLFKQALLEIYRLAQILRERAVDQAADAQLVAALRLNTGLFFLDVGVVLLLAHAQLLTQAGFLDVTVRRDGPQADAGRVFLTAMRSLEYGSETMESTNPVG